MPIRWPKPLYHPGYAMAFGAGLGASVAVGVMLMAIPIAPRQDPVIDAFDFPGRELGFPERELEFLDETSYHVQIDELSLKEKRQLLDQLRRLSEHSEGGRRLLKQRIAQLEEAVGRSQEVVVAAPKDGSDEVVAVLDDAREDPIEAAVKKQAWPASSEIELDQTMHLGKVYEARLLIQRGQAEELRNLAESTNEPTAAAMAIQVTPDVGATAISQQLKITPIDPEWQTIRTAAPTIWTWRVEPFSEGVATVQFTLRQKVMVDGNEKIVTVEHFPHRVEVTVGPLARVGQALSATWRYMLDNAGKMTALIGLLGLGYAGYRRWRTPNGKPDGADVAETPEPGSKKA